MPNPNPNPNPNQAAPTTPRASSVRTTPSNLLFAASVLITTPLLCRPPPPVRPLHKVVPQLGSGPGPVRCAALKPNASSRLSPPPLACAASVPTPSLETLAGAAASPSASRRPATRATPALKFAHVPCHATMKPLIQFSTPHRMVPLELAQCVGTSNHNPNHHPRSLFSLRAPQARPDGLLGALNACSTSTNARLRDQEVWQILAAIGGTLGRVLRVCVWEVCACVRRGESCVFQKCYISAHQHHSRVTAHV